MKLKSVIDSPCGLRFCFEMLNLQSGYSRRYLLDMEMMTSKEDIMPVYAQVEKFRKVFCKEENKVFLQTLQFKLQGLKDIEQTVNKLSYHRVLDDIELFEIKHLSLLALDVKEMLDRFSVENFIDKTISRVVDILDPDHLKISSFYIYDSYSKELALLRSRIKSTPEGDERQELISQSLILEADLRRDISFKLSPYGALLLSTLTILADVDISISKAVMMEKYDFTFPLFSKGSYVLKSMFNPQVKAALEENGRQFQCVDIEYGKDPVLIIGANMGGKTVVLKTLALCQYLFQFGFPVPVKKAEMGIKEEVYLVCGDQQSEIKGLSSFASEMKNIDEVIRNSSHGSDILALIDEPARSTNPIEGTALVSSLITILSQKNVSLVLTTHYNIDSQNCIRLKVKGLENGVMNYQLKVSKDSDVPHEALNVAESLNVSKEWIKEAKSVLKTNLKKK